MKMHTIPVTVLDNFFENPKEVRDFALKQDFFTSEDYRWPGKRTKPLHEICPRLHNYICSKVMSLFFTNINDVHHMVVNATFQLVPAKYGKGWIHRDDAIISGIIYLNEEHIPNSGTTIYDMIYDGIMHDINHKRDFFAGKINTDEPYKSEYNSLFEEAVVVKNKFNRMIAFDGQLNHAANDFSGHNAKDSRLTLVFFINSLDVDKTPIRRFDIT